MGEELNPQIAEFIGSFTLSDINGNTVLSEECTTSLADNPIQPDDNELAFTFTRNKECVIESIQNEINVKAIDVDLLIPKTVQARKHKKKRINKKWLKRYGYKTVMVRSKGWRIGNSHDGMVSFTKEGKVFD